MTDPITPLTPSEIAKQQAETAKEGYIRRDLVGFDQFVNVLAGGKPDETISSRAARADERGAWWGKTMSRVLNLFQKDHGAIAKVGDAERAEAVEQLEEKSGAD